MKFNFELDPKEVELVTTLLETTASSVGQAFMLGMQHNQEVENRRMEAVLNTLNQQVKSLKTDLSNEKAQRFREILEKGMTKLMEEAEAQEKQRTKKKDE